MKQPDRYTTHTPVYTSPNTITMDTSPIEKSMAPNNTRKSQTEETRELQQAEDEGFNWPDDIPDDIKDEVDTVASKRIVRFLKKYRKKSRSRFIKRFCSDPGLCIAFDPVNRDKINKHFNHFNTLKYISGAIKQIGETSANGFVKEVKFTHDNYSAYAVLKSSVTYTSDNLVYEYLAGQFINHQCNYLPCFVETYGLFYYKDDSAWEMFKTQKLTVANDFVAGLELQSSGTVDYAKACKESRRAAVLLQYIHGAKVLHSFISNSNEFNAYQMIYQMIY